MQALNTGAAQLNAPTPSSAYHITLFPTATPTTTEDPWYCATENVPQYFDSPEPTGSLLDELLSYGDKLQENCTISITPGATIVPTCPFPEQSSICAFTNAAPTDVLPEYFSFASSASTWWSAHSSRAIELAQECPNHWQKAMRETLYGEARLKNTIAYGQCYAEAFPVNGPRPNQATPSASTTPEAGLPPTESKSFNGAPVHKSNVNSIIVVAGMIAGALGLAF
ncbi:hypothetical protein IQ07DRAFT_422984 [Pyrenochaeta sp. DS3sAY3a]|nr:hypothetical protein IQ07DRAFT_422984 [Pyrenochaeta sp. DS3sAY3a]